MKRFFVKNIKLSIAILVLIAILTMSINSFAASKSVELKQNSVTVAKGKTLQLELKKGDASKVKWTVADKYKDIVKVTQKGKIRGLSSGTAVVTASLKDDKTIKANCKIKVVELEFKDRYKTVNYNDDEKQTINFKELLNFKNINIKDIKWEITKLDEEILEEEYNKLSKEQREGKKVQMATIDDNGIVTVNRSNRLGARTVIATLKDTDIKAKCKLTVVGHKDMLEKADIKLDILSNPNTTQIKEGEVLELTPQVTIDANGTKANRYANRKVTMTVDKPDVLKMKIDKRTRTLENGTEEIYYVAIMTGKKPGTATVHTVVRSTENLGKEKVVQKDIKIKVLEEEKPVITLNNPPQTMTVGDTVKVADIATIKPDGTVMTAKSSSKKIIKIENGKLQALKAGTAKITISADKADSKEFTVTVKNKEVKVTKLEIPETLTVYIGGKIKKLPATVNPNDAKVTWSIDNNKIATVSSKGKVTGLKVGTARVTATAGDKTANCTVTVKKFIESITPKTNATVKNNKIVISAKQGDVVNLNDYVTIKPSDATISYSVTNANATTSGKITMGNETVTAAIKGVNKENKVVTQKFTIKLKTTENTSQNGNSNQVQTATNNGKMIFVGDSRTVGMYYSLHSGYSNPIDIKNNKERWMAQVGEGYDKMVTYLKKLANDNELVEGTNVIILMGLNDIWKYDNYASIVSKYAKKYKTTNFYFVSVNPVKNKNRTVSANAIAKFNKEMKKGINKANLDNLKYLDIYDFVDGICTATDKYGHYNQDSGKTNKAIYNKIYELVKGN